MDNLILRAKTCNMLDYMDDRLRNYPREQYHGITPRMRETGYKMLEISANIENGYYTATMLKDYDKAKNALKAFVNYSLHRRFISPQNHKTWSTMLDELGRITGGLLGALPQSSKR